MKIFIIIAMTTLSMQSCSQSNSNSFVSKVINDFSRNSYFIILNTELSEGINISLIENDDLFYYFNQTKGYNEETYKKEIEIIMRERRVLKITDADFAKFEFIKVKSIPMLNKEAKKGKEFIVNKYFKNRVIVDNVSDDQKNFLIKMLFDWSVASRIDDETGYLIIDKIK